MMIISDSCRISAPAVAVQVASGQPQAEARGVGTTFCDDNFHSCLRLGPDAVGEAQAVTVLSVDSQANSKTVDGRVRHSGPARAESEARRRGCNRGE